MNPQSATTTLVQQLAIALKTRQWMLATAESCTGGMVAAACTDLAGSSQWFERGFVTYSNQAKMDLLAVPATDLQAFGAVSEPVARAMAQGAVQHSAAHCALATTGIAGPGGASASKPVGLVWFGWSVNGHLHTAQRIFDGDRDAVREAATQFALSQLLRLLDSS